MIVSPLNTARFPVPLEWGEPPGADAVPAARRLVGAIVREWGVPLSADGLQEVELCASEVIANALVHTKGRCAVTVRWCAGRVRVEVADRCPELPKRERGAGSTSGRGLLLVEALAHTWGWRPAGAGKVVWFEYLEVAEAPCPTHGWGAALDLHALREVA
ncbi:ATP-binding protein [Kitasatospora sp. NBC_01300]|uniref:ATP-binding protein n=1 Tax=Kitasatospora sp. NBC_01300 TaxID=2903574 RepID=UPI00352F2821|nr:ATP-binding protein [Kitasatospora sp. NBC_01300]